MKILWFSNTPCGARALIDKKGVNGGWLNALENSLVEVNNIELHICFYWGIKLKPFKVNKTTYHPVLRKNIGSKLGRFINEITICDRDRNEVKKLLEVVNEVKPDLIHIHGTEDNFGLIQEYVDLPIIISIQGIINSISLKLFTGIPLSTLKRHEGLLSKLSLTSSRHYYRKINRIAFREKKILSLSKNIIGRTDWDMRITRLLSPNSKYFIGQELMRPIFYEQYWDKKKFNDCHTIITILGDSIYKGFESIIQTAQILKSCDFIDFEWLVIGIDNKSKTAKIVEKWLKVNFESVNVNLLGLKSEFEIVKLLTYSDIYCQMSHIENSPNSLCEALLLGMPCIASFAGGTDTILLNKEEGLLVQDGDHLSYASAILYYIDNFDKAKKHGQNARKTALIRHNREKIKDSIINTYHNLI